MGIGSEVDLMRRSRSILRPASFLALATVALIAFIAITGDLRRERNAMARARVCASELTDRVGPGGRLPLNLSATDSRVAEAQGIGMESLSSADAHLLRGVGGRVLSAWTMPIVRAMGADGRATVWFEGGAFSVQWMTLSAFETALAEQNARVASLRDS